MTLGILWFSGVFQAVIVSIALVACGRYWREASIVHRNVIRGGQNHGAIHWCRMMLVATKYLTMLQCVFMGAIAERLYLLSAGDIAIRSYMHYFAFGWVWAASSGFSVATASAIAASHRVLRDGGA